MTADPGAPLTFLRRLTAGVYPGASGPVVASLFQRAMAIVLMFAWASLGWQIRLLIGQEGLLPLRPLVAGFHGAGASAAPGWLEFPTVLRWPVLTGDAALVGGTFLGFCLALLALFRIFPRINFLLSVALYLSYATACRSFLAFQWDNLLLESALLAAFLPAHRPAPLVHLLFRVVLFKLYFESGLAKWQSPINDWEDGSAMSFYYETAPLPTPLAFFAHHLPGIWHRFESWAVLAGELLVPFLIFAGRRARLVAAATFSIFQLTNLLTANYGFFCYLSLALHLFLLDDGDLQRVLAALRARLPGRWQPVAGPPSIPTGSQGETPVLRPRMAIPPALWLSVSLLGAGLHLGVSLLEGLERFAPPGPWQAQLLPLSRIYGPLRLVNSYHLFASVTRERIEPQVEVRVARRWVPLDLSYKPGPVARRPPFVAPHQPRVDFLLWFHGLAWQRPPAYLGSLLERVCHSPHAVAALFATPVPPRAEAVRMTYHRYRFAPVTEWRRTGVYWQRAFVGTGLALSCDR